MVLASTKMVKAAKLLSIPCYATEQNPKIRIMVLLTFWGKIAGLLEHVLFVITL